MRKPQKKQTLLSLAILVVLAGIGSGILLKHDRYNPAVLSLRPSVSGAAGRVQTPASRSTGFPFSAPPNMVPLTPAEVFNPQNLSDKIIGKACGFRDLYCTKILAQQKVAQLRVKYV